LAPVFKKKIRQPKQKRLPNALSEPQVRDLLPRLKNPIYKACCTVIYACGLRAGEGTALEIGTIDGVNRHLRIVGKGNKERIVPLPHPVLDGLREFWKTHKNPRWLFPNKAGDGPIGRGALSRAFALAAREAGITGATLHSLRHGYATKLIERGINLAIVQILLGHGSIKTTTVYIHLTEPIRASLTRILDELMTGF
jgi:integrase/recombinase XerD